ncbi:MAG: 2-succinyl-5-enolpyruvyl-6-hydroxy-3-cyclohexene-1-carboxylic-acid synthase [Cytophagales bacterium]|nr:2-succinyl-5-enolpyruvyl-6-hydroxy-3-cyclohexene-1-carboxylic-acid synthase [Cytophagales bacterium]MDW8383396.1 2-succinyl-5-enolpyruvyl-6-hydroxy-3-cyclohexene-1-carboxylic-acid synthase [Flammeovirgaceae bacterium]
MSSYALQSIVDLARICALKGISNAVLCPGSRCAPLIIAFSRQPSIRSWSVTDERTAGFIALGMAQATQKPVAVVCTSGTAALNLSPAIAEAYYQNIPLLVLTADRPPEWIDQLDGQTIRQAEIYRNHVKKSYQLPVDYENVDSQWYINRITNEAINLATSFPPAPVHINVPIREPFYPKVEDRVQIDNSVRIFNEYIPTCKYSLPDELIKIWQSSSRKLLVLGQLLPCRFLIDVLENFPAVIVGDIISNTHFSQKTIRNQDAFLCDNDLNIQNLVPDLLITVGNSLISKNLKIFLRKNNFQHWHIQPHGEVADTFQKLSAVVRAEPFEFLRELSQIFSWQNPDFALAWNQKDMTAESVKKEYFQSQPFSEFEAVAALMRQLPQNAVLHLANSMPVRYANFVGLSATQQVEVFANRGTSGIDGCTSTAIGHAIVTPHKQHFLLIGDIAFFYDRNAFWLRHLPQNFHIVLLNNQGGGIFRMIEGPDRLPELEFLETSHSLNAQMLCHEFSVQYFSVRTKEQLYENLEHFLNSNAISLLEIFTDKSVNKEVFKNYLRVVRSF